jgi:hypothetical protein
MKLTRDKFRLKCGVASVLLALALVPLVDWNYFRGTFFSPVETRRNTSFMERRQKSIPLAVSVALIVAGVSLCFEFAGDPPPRKDPWDNEQK